MSVVLDLKVMPKAKHSKIKIDKSGKMVFYLKNPPEDNKANEELLTILSEKLQIPRRNIVIVLGKSSKNKRVKFIDNSLTLDIVLDRLKVSE